MRINPLVLMSDLLILLLMLLGLDSGEGTHGQEGAPGGLPEPLRVAREVETEQPDESAAEGHGVVGLLLRLGPDGDLQTGDGGKLAIDAVVDEMERRRASGVTLLPASGVSYQQVYDVAHTLSQQGVPVDLSSSGAPPEQGIGRRAANPMTE